MNKNAAYKATAYALACAGAAIAAPAVMPLFACFATKELLGATVSELFKDNNSLGSIALDKLGSAIGGFATEFGGSAFEKLPAAWRREGNHDLEKALAEAWRKALNEIAEPTNDEALQNQWREWQPLWLNRITRAQKSDDVATLFLHARDTAGQTTKDYVLLLADEDNANLFMATALVAALPRWAEEQRGATAQRTQTLQLTEAVTPLPAALQTFLVNKAPAEVAYQFGLVVREGEFNKSWIAWQQAHSLSVSQVLANVAGDTAAMRQRLDELAQSDQYAKANADALAECLALARATRQEQEDYARAAATQLRAVEASILSAVGQAKVEILSEMQTGNQRVIDVFDEVKTLLQSQPRLTAAGAELLPPPPHPFVGRDAQLKAMVADLLPEQAVLVFGSAGMGKTTLTEAALHQPDVTLRFGERRFFVRCETASSREMLAQQIGRQLGLGSEAYNENLIAQTLQAAPALLVLDNLETPWRAQQVAVESLCRTLAVLSNVCVLASFRGAGELPRLNGQQTNYDPQPLSLEDARRVWHALAASLTEPAAVLDELLNAMDGVPLALTLLAEAALLEGDLSVTARRWQAERTRLLARGAADARELSWRVSLGLSLAHPTVAEGTAARHLFALLGQLPCGMAEADRVALLPDDAYQAAAALKRLALVQVTPGRLRLLNPFREYAQSECPLSPADEQRLIDHYVALAEIGSKVGSKEGAEVVARLTPEVTNIETMLVRGLATDDFEKAAWAATRYAQLVICAGVGSSVPLLTVTAHRSSRHLANAIFQLGSIAQIHLRYSEAKERYEEALPLFQQSGNHLEEVNCLFRLAEIAKATSQYDQSVSRFELVMDRYKQLGNVIGEANCIYRLGEIARETWQYDVAELRYEAARPLYKQEGDVLGEANCIKNLGNIALHRSLYDEAKTFFEDALLLFQELGIPFNVANCICSLGEIAQGKLEYDEAESRYQAASDLYQRSGHTLGEANCKLLLGKMAHERDQLDKAREYYLNALEMFRQIPEPYSIASTHRLLAHIAHTNDEKNYHVASARAALNKDSFDWLLKELDEEFGEA